MFRLSGPVCLCLLILYVPIARQGLLQAIDHAAASMAPLVPYTGTMVYAPQLKV